MGPFVLLPKLVNFIVTFRQIACIVACFFEGEPVVAYHATLLKIVRFLQ